MDRRRNGEVKRLLPHAIRPASYWLRLIADPLECWDMESKDEEKQGPGKVSCMCIRGNGVVLAC